MRACVRVARACTAAGIIVASDYLMSHFKSANTHARARMQSFSAHLEEFARTQSLRLRLDEDLLDSACLDAIESLCERICDGDGSTDVDLVHLYDFLFSADEMVPASARVGYEKHVTALRAAGFGLGTRRKHKRSSCSPGTSPPTRTGR